MSNHIQNILKYRSNGKLMLTGEYLVLKGAKSLSLPVKFGQELTIEQIEEKKIYWNSTVKNKDWFNVEFSMPQLQLISTNNIKIAETLQNILFEACKLNSSFLKDYGFSIKTNIEFDVEWGLGSSSSLISNIAYWANCDPFELNRRVFKGSGYDIACARSAMPILYQMHEEKPFIKNINFNPNFSENLFFVWLNKKQNTRLAIGKLSPVENYKEEIERVNEITTKIIACNNLSEFQNLIEKHEIVIAEILKTKTVKELFFSDFDGAIKSLGAWGGDFVLVATNRDAEDVKKYFKQRGFNTVLSYNEMIIPS